MTEADPETTEALCLAVAAFDGRRADALLDAGADPLRPLPDGSTPLLRAVASGNAGVTVALLRHAEGRTRRRSGQLSSSALGTGTRPAPKPGFASQPVRRARSKAAGSSTISTATCTT